ncbi:PTPN2 isoform 7, partial [Pan troglodytes]
EEAQRSYILTQGPLPNTCCHFWLMVWQQKTKAVVMLNRIVEKESKRWKELSKEDLSPAFDHSPNKIITEKYNGNRIGLEEEKLTGDRYTGLSSKMQDTMEENSESALRKRIREDRKATTAQKVQQMKQRLNENERKRKRPRLTDT